MAIERFINDTGDGVIVAYDGDEAEFVDPVEHFTNAHSAMLGEAYRQYLHSKNSLITSLIPDAFFFKKGKEMWEQQLTQIRAIPVPPNFVSLYDSKTKSEQGKLLRDASLTTDELANFLFTSKDHGYAFSTYKSERLPSNIKASDLPKFIRVNGDVVTKKGLTPLTDGQLKSIIFQRAVIVARIIDRGRDWHALFLTYKSIRGEESWKKGQPHLHYISDKWGIPRADLIKQIKAGQHPSSRIHIALHRN